MLAIWQTAVHHQMIHGLAMLGLVALWQRYDQKRLGQTALFIPDRHSDFQRQPVPACLHRHQVAGLSSHQSAAGFLGGWIALLFTAIASKPEQQTS